MTGEIIAEKIRALSNLSETAALVTIDDFEKGQGCSLFGGLRVRVGDLEKISALDGLAREGQLLVDKIARVPAELVIRRNDAAEFI